MSTTVSTSGLPGSNTRSPFQDMQSTGTKSGLLLPSRGPYTPSELLESEAADTRNRPPITNTTPAPTPITASPTQAIPSGGRPVPGVNPYQHAPVSMSMPRNFDPTAVRFMQPGDTSYDAIKLKFYNQLNLKPPGGPPQPADAMKFRGLAVPQMSQRTVAIPAPPPALRPQQRVPGELRTGTGTGTGVPMPVPGMGLPQASTSPPSYDGGPDNEEDMLFAMDDDDSHSANPNATHNPSKQRSSAGRRGFLDTYPPSPPSGTGNHFDDEEDDSDDFIPPHILAAQQAGGLPAFSLPERRRYFGE